MNELFEDPLFRDVKRVFQALGLWPYQRLWIRVIIIFIIFMAEAPAQFTQIWYFVDVIHNTKEMINCLPAIFMAYAGNLAYLNTAIYFNKLKDIFDEMKNNWTQEMNAEERIILEKWAKTSCLRVKVYLVIACIAINMFCLLPLLAMLINLLFPSDEPQPIENILKLHFFNVDPIVYYVPMYFYNYTTSNLTILMVLAYDVYLIMATHHIISLFVVLSSKINKIGQMKEDLRYGLSEHQLDRILSDEIRKCVQYHSNSIRFSGLIEDSQKYLWILQIFSNVILITIMGVQALTNTNKPIHLISFAVNTLSMITRLFTISWCGQQIFNYSDNLYNSICNLEWYDFPPRSKKLLLFMLVRSFKPCRITAGGMINLNMETYGNCLKTASSYFTLIFSTQ